MVAAVVELEATLGVVIPVVVWAEVDWVAAMEGMPEVVSVLVTVKEVDQVAVAMAQGAWGSVGVEEEAEAALVMVVVEALVRVVAKAMEGAGKETVVRDLER